MFNVSIDSVLVHMNNICLMTRRSHLHIHLKTMRYHRYKKLIFYAKLTDNSVCNKLSVRTNILTKKPATANNFRQRHAVLR